MSAAVTIRAAQRRDLDALVGFEQAIARISFGDNAVVDDATHRGRLEKALERDPGSVFVAVDADDHAVGWLWMAANTNFLTGDRYANLRSLAVDDGYGNEGVSEALLERAIAFARDNELDEITGKVHPANNRMRVLYRRLGFEPTTLTMRRVERGGPGTPPQPGSSP
jgi:ribosomal protein S18 acetylase RimI-like enzyme